MNQKWYMTKIPERFGTPDFKMNQSQNRNISLLCINISVTNRLAFFQRTVILFYFWRVFSHFLVIDHLKLQLFFTFLVCLDPVCGVYCPHLVCLDITLTKDLGVVLIRLYSGKRITILSSTQSFH